MKFLQPKLMYLFSNFTYCHPKGGAKGHAGIDTPFYLGSEMA